ncbi:unnamed protein product [Porites lobata]|uniref:Uncharacterized protein n=1 Tax=Porites lobata TaxID=104759 RepID=A0ABN8QBG2_9CNID|nr:unnamed protein product [Porites lobata]
MSDAQASLNPEEENPNVSVLEEEGSSERVERKSKGKKKTKGFAKTRKGKGLEEEADEDEVPSRPGKKKKGKKKAARKVSDTSETGENSILDDTPKETVIEIKDEKEGDAELQEIVVKKEEAQVEGDNVVEEAAVPVEGSEEEKKDNKKDGEGEEPKETVPDSERPGVRRRATLSDLKSESVDKGDEEQAADATAGSEELDSVKEEVSIEIKKEAETAEDEKDTDTKETASKAGIDETSTEQKEEDATTEAGKPAERTEAGQDEKPEAVAIAMDETVVPVEEEVKTEAAEGGESVVKTGSTEGGEDENVEHVVVPVEEEVKSEAAEGGEGVVKTGSTEGGEGEPSQEDAVPVTMETTVTNENETGEDHSKYDELDDELPWAMYRSLDTPPQRPPVEEDDDWPASDDDGDYAPPKNDDLPDLDMLMGTLDGGESELETTASPPPLILPEEKHAKQRRIEELKQGIANDPIDLYDEEFEKRVEDEILMIGNISLEMVQEEERRLRDEHIAYQQQQAKVQRERQEDLLMREAKAKKEVMKVMRAKRKRLQQREDLMMQQDRLIQNRIHRAFRRAEEQLLKSLTARKGEVKAMYGDLILADGQYGGSKGRRWKVDWNRTPQPIQIKLKCLRGVKDKLPAGRYVLMVSLYDRLGGHVLKWSNLKGQQWGGATLPLQHDGEFFNIEVKIDQSVFTVCPSKPDVRPGMILVFELFILRGSVTPTDRVVGWGCFPICDGEFNIVDGKYKAPFLRGDMDPHIDKHEKIEELMADDLENWLCNLYFEIVKLPRYMAGQKEYEVELQFTSGILSYPSRTNIDEENIDGEEPIFGSRIDLKSPSPSSSRRGSRISMMGSSFFGSSAHIESAVEEKEGMGSSHNLQVEVPEMRRTSLAVPDPMLRQRRSSASSRRLSRPVTTHTSRRAAEGDASSDGSGTDYSDDEVLMLKKDDGFRPVKGQPGMYYKKHLNNPVDVHAKKMFTMLPKTPLMTRKKKRKKLTHLEELEEHTFTVQPPWSNKGHIPRYDREKMQYVGRQLMAELGLSQWRSREFWAMLLLIAFTWWLRLYAHYGGQWVYLQALAVPVSKYDFLAYTVTLNYQSTLLKTREEISMVVLGPFTNIIIFCLTVIFSWILQRLYGTSPNIFSRFIMAYGINVLLDPIWILIVDSALMRYVNVGGDVPIGDAFKLYWHFIRFENNGAVGIVLTVFLYIVTIFTSSVVIYFYFLRIHNNGRLMDVYHRLHAREDEFFIPYDLEISNVELSYISKKAEQYRGEEGERRKTAVYDYIWEEEQIDESDMGTSDRKKTGHREITTHVSIHTIHLDGLRELYRHFLRLPDGAVVEVFGEMGVVGMDESIKQALIKGTTYQSMDSAKGSRASIRGRSRTGSGISESSLRRPSVMLEVPKTSRAPSPV